MKQTTQKREQHKAEGILLVIKAWSFYSKAGDYVSMNNLCLRDSKFAEITGMCERGNRIGIRFYYEFTGLKLVTIDNNDGKAIISGRIKLIQSGGSLISSGKIMAGAKQFPTLKGEEQWKLSEIEIEWDD
jgi:hypothetical protein